MAFTDIGIENLIELIRIHKEMRSRQAALPGSRLQETKTARKPVGLRARSCFRPT